VHARVLRAQQQKGRQVSRDAALIDKFSSSQDRTGTSHVNTEIAVHIYCNVYQVGKGARGSVVVKALCYKPEGRGFETR
jgi:hypothetical protein